MKKLIAANWKMNKTVDESLSYIRKFKGLIKDADGVEVLLCPPFIALHSVGSQTKITKIKLGAQNMHHEEKGAYTGETSPNMLKDIGCEYVILGHSERRQYFNETDELINKKVLSALEHRLKPILCVGETLEERNAKKTSKVIRKQLVEGLKDVGANHFNNIVIAYEPKWAIGTGKTPSLDEIEIVHELIKNILKETFSASARILYGGSVNEKNAEDIMKLPGVNGGLIGGASLDAGKFSQIINKTAEIIKHS